MDVDPIRGVIAPNMTPFNDDLSIATDLYIENAERLLAGGCAALAPFGTTGEALSIGAAERIEVMQSLVSAGLPAARMIPGTGLNNITETAELSRRFVDMGCAGVMTLPPFYLQRRARGWPLCLLRKIDREDRPAKAAPLSLPYPTSRRGRYSGNPGATLKIGLS